MRILILSWRDPKHPLAGGAEQVIHEHSKGWIKNGHEITLFSSRYNNSKKSEILDGVRIIRKGSQYLGVQLEAFWFYFFNKEKFDLVVDQFHGIPFFTPLYVKKPILAIIQETAREIWFLNHFIFPINYIIGVLGFYLEPLIFLFYKNNQFMTGAESVKKDLVLFGIDLKKISVINHGLKYNRLPRPQKKNKFPTFAYFGRLSKDKGIEDVIKTFKLLNAKYHNSAFWIIGEAETNAYNAKIHQLIKELNLSKKTTFFGRVSDIKKFELLSKVHILVNASKREGWGLVNIEANLVGTPVVAYDSLGLRDSVRNNYSGLLSEKKTPEALKSKVLELLDNERRYNRISKASTKWAKKFTWNLSIKKSLKLLEKIENEN